MLRGTAMDGAGISSAASDEAIVDLVKLSEILGETDPAEFAAHLELFFAHFPSLMDRLDAALAAGHHADIAATAHAAAGAAGMAGASRLRALLLRIETAARAGDVSSIAALGPSVRSEYAGVEAFVGAGGLSEGVR